MYKLNILGKSYSIQTSLPSNEINRIVKEINEKYKHLEAQYRTFDRIDILIFYLIELYEMVYNLKKEIEKEKEYKKRIKKKIEDMEKSIRSQIELLTKGKKGDIML